MPSNGSETDRVPRTGTAAMITIITRRASQADEGIVHTHSNVGLMCLYGSGPAKVAESVTKATGEYYSLEDARQNIKDYFTKFNKLKKWLDERKDFISTNGYTYSFFGRKRRLPNVFSADKGIAAHEVRSGINMEVQSLNKSGRL